MRYVVALGIVVGFGLLLEDGSLWLTIPIGFAVILVVNKLGDVAMERSTAPSRAPASSCG